MISQLACLTVGSARPVAARATTPPIDSLLRVVRTAPSPAAKVRACITLAAFSQYEDSARAYHYARQALAFSRHGPDSLTAMAWRAMGVVAYATGNYRRALACCDSALAVPSAINYPVATCHNLRGVVYTAMGNYDQALKSLKKEIKILYLIKNPKNLDITLKNAGNIYHFLGNYQKSIEYYFESLKAAQRSGNRSLQAEIHLAIAGVFDEQEDDQQAFQYNRRASRIYEQLNDTINSVISIAQTSNSLIFLHDLPEAEKELKKAYALLKAYSQQTEPAQWAWLEGYFGRLKLEQNKPNEAIPFLKNAIEKFTKNTLSENKVTCLASLANAYLLAHRPGEALQTATEAMNLAGDLRTPRTLAAAYETMATVCQATGRFREAYNYRVRYEAVHDSLLRNQFREKLALYHTQYEVRRREEKIGLLQKNTHLLQSKAHLQQRLAWALGSGLLLAVVLGIVGVQRYRNQRRFIAALTEKDATIATVNAELRRALEDKDVLMREIHHRVKNNLQVIASLLGLQALENEQLPHVVDALQEGENRVKAMALIHELLYRDDHLSRIDFAHFLRQLLHYLSRTYAIGASLPPPDTDTYQLLLRAPDKAAPRHQPVTIELQVLPVLLTPDVAVPLGLIANEIVINAFRHAFVDVRAGHLCIMLGPTAAKNAYELRIIDNGVGLPPDFSLSATRSLGLRLVGKLARQLRAELELRTTPEGTLFCLQFSEHHRQPAAPGHVAPLTVPTNA